jgi:hypothetical protein
MQPAMRFNRAQVVASLLAGGCLSGPALAAIVYSGPVAIPIPDTLDGIYMNMVTGASGTAPVAGWDINPYSALTPATNFNLWGVNTTTWFSAGGVAAGPYVLAPGTEIGPAETYFRPGGGTNIAPQVTLDSDENLFGFQFPNEDNGGQIHHGWMRVEFGANPGIRSIVEYAYDDVAGAPIAAGDTGVPDIVWSGPVDIAIPDNLDGIYMNVVTGETGSSAVAGWDINPYSALSPGTNFNLWGVNTTTWLSAGGVIAGPYVLAPGTEIGPAGTYFRPGGGTNIAPQVNLSSDENLFGFQFPNEDNGGAIHHGWMRVEFGANPGVRRIVEYAYAIEALTPIAAGETGQVDEIFANGFEGM